VHEVAAFGPLDVGQAAPVAARQLAVAVAEYQLPALALVHGGAETAGAQADAGLVLLDLDLRLAGAGHRHAQARRGVDEVPHLHADHAGQRRGQAQRQHGAAQGVAAVLDGARGGEQQKGIAVAAHGGGLGGVVRTDAALQQPLAVGELHAEGIVSGRAARSPAPGLLGSVLRAKRRNVTPAAVPCGWAASLVAARLFRHSVSTALVRSMAELKSKPNKESSR
jgi:hypothetical protein